MFTEGTENMAYLNGWPCTFMEYWRFHRYIRGYRSHSSACLHAGASNLYVSNSFFFTRSVKCLSFWELQPMGGLFQLGS